MAGCTGVATTYKLSSTADLTKTPQPLTTEQLKVSEVPPLALRKPASSFEDSQPFYP